MRPGQTLFTYFHFAADERLTTAIIDSGTTAIAYETLRDPRGGLPLLTPDERGRRPDEHPGGCQVPRAAAGGRGASCSPACRASRPPRSPSWAAASSAPMPPRSPRAWAPTVRILDINLDRLRYLDDIMPPNVTTLYSDRHTILESIERADLVIGAVLITGARRPAWCVAMTSAG